MKVTVLHSTSAVLALAITDANGTMLASMEVVNLGAKNHLTSDQFNLTLATNNNCVKVETQLME